QSYTDFICYIICVCTHTSYCVLFFFFFSSRRRHTRSKRDWSSDVCSSDLPFSSRVGIPAWSILLEHIRFLIWSMISGPIWASRPFLRSIWSAWKRKFRSLPDCFQPAPTVCWKRLDRKSVVRERGEVCGDAE